METRTAAYKELYKISADGNGYTLENLASYYSDSCNPKGEMRSYWAPLKTYKTMNGAINGLRKILDCHFLEGYEHLVDEIVQVIVDRAAHEH